MRYGYGTLGIIVHPFAGAWGPEFSLMVDNDQLRRTRGVRGFFGRELVQRMDWLAHPPDNPRLSTCGIVYRDESRHLMFNVGRGKVWNVSW